MRIGVIPTNPIERLILGWNLIPEPMVTTQMAYTMARAIMAGVDVGIFETLARGPLKAEAISDACETHPKATQALLRALVGCGYLDYCRRDSTYKLKKGAQKWLLQNSPHSLSNKMKLQQYEWEVLGKLETYIRDGKPLDLHNSPEGEIWGDYQAGMVDVGRLALAENTSRTPMPKMATRMLDIGGSGGTYSAAYLKKYPDLSSRILDLPSAVVHARPFIERHGLGSRLEIVAGNAVTDDLGEETYDFIFMANVSHHLSEKQNAEVARKAFTALRMNGVFSIVEFERSDVPSWANQIGSLMDLSFCFTSESGTWSCREMESWLVQAGFKAGKPIRYRSSPGFVQVWGRKAGCME